MNVGIFIFDKVEVLDFAGPYEVFSTAARVHRRLNPAAGKLLEVFTVAETVGPIVANGNLSVNPARSFDQHAPLDLLIVPGGDVSAELEKPTVISWIKQCGSTAQICASVCTGAFLLARAGLLRGRSATTHWEDIEDLRSMFPDVTVRERARYIDEGRVVTSAGISAGIDMSLYLLSRIAGRSLAERTARQMEYDWNPDTT